VPPLTSSAASDEPRLWNLHFSFCNVELAILKQCRWNVSSEGGNRIDRWLTEARIGTESAMKLNGDDGSIEVSL